MQKKHKIFIIAGEASGDYIGSKLIVALRSKIPESSFHGVGGEKMNQAGVTSIFPIEDLSVMGLIEVLPKIPEIMHRMNQVLNSIDIIKPDVIITIDSPAFNFRLVKKIRNKLKLKTPIIHYVAPTVWAYKPERAQLISKLFNHILLILPFEKKYFDAVNLPATFVGHPIIEDNIPSINFDAIRKKYNLRNEKIITLFPGSRIFEIKQHLPVLTKFMRALSNKYGSIKYCIPTLPGLKNIIEDALSDDLIITDDIQEKDYFLSISDLAICKSGTVSLEAMKKNIPSVVGYKVNKITAWWVRQKLMIKYVTLCNILLDEEVIPELLQENFTVENLTQAAVKLLENRDCREKQKDRYKKALKKLQPKINELPSIIAAEVICSYIL